MAIIDRAKAEALIQEQVVAEIFQNAPKKSVVMSLGRKLPNMTSKQTRLRVLDTLPMAYWVNGDTGYKQTSDTSWENVYLTASELAVIVPIPEAVLDDADIDIIGEVKPRIEEAIAKRVDDAILFGNGKPSEWGADVITRARQAGNNVAISGSADFYDAVLGVGGAFSKVEECGYAVNGSIGSLAVKSKMRGLRTTDGVPVFTSNPNGATQYTLDGTPIYFADNGSFDKSVAQLIVGDFSQLVYAIRQDITVKILDQGIIQNPATGDIVYNLAQQDMIALRVVFRMGWALPNPVNPENVDRVNCPFAYIEPTTPATTQTVTFTVQDSDSTAIAGATVDVDGARLKTGSQGTAVFNLRAGTYHATIKKAGYTTQTVDVTVSNSAVSQTITLA